MIITNYNYHMEYNSYIDIFIHSYIHTSVK